MVRAVIFDLDGTLYQDVNFYIRYTKYLFEGNRFESSLEDIIKKVTDLLDGKLSFRLGDFWKVDSDDIAVDVLSLFNIPRAKNQADIFRKLLPESEYLYAGDAWSALRILCRRAGISEEHRMRCFNRVRAEMLTQQHEITYDTELFDTLYRLSRRLPTYMFTNTAKDAADTFTKHLNLFDKIGTIQYQCAKPYGFAKLIPEIMRQTGAEESELLSVGDHSFNDLTPFYQCGAQTLLVSPYEIYDNMPWTNRLYTLEQLKEHLNNII